MVSYRYVLIVASVLSLVASSMHAQDARRGSGTSSIKQLHATKPLKVFILAGQSNMVGHSSGHTMGTLLNADGPKDKMLTELVFRRESMLSKKRFEDALALGRQLNELTGGAGDPKIKAIANSDEKLAAEAEAERLKALLERYKTDVIEASADSDRVYITAIADNHRKSGKIAVGYGANDTMIGPEYGFGLSIAKKLDGPILLIKTSWGGKSLNYDFRPPSLSDFKTTPEYAEAMANAAAEEERQKLRKPNNPSLPRTPRPFSMDKAGLNYHMMIDEIHKVLDNLQEHHPGYDPVSGYELAGFVWFQGFNDQFNDHFKANYKDNLVALINDVRQEFRTPQLPFVIGILGTPQIKEKVDANAVSVAQREAAAIPEFKNNVVAVESYTDYALDSLEVYNSGWQQNFYVWSLVGSDRPYHYLGSGKFFVRLGDSFASAMAELIAKQRIPESQ